MEKDLIARLKELQKAYEMQVKFVLKENDSLTTDELNDMMFALADANNSNYDLQKQLMNKFG